MNERAAKWTGMVLGLTIAIVFLVYLPMKANYDECGAVFLCSAHLNAPEQP
jgi:hypothetical protein